MMEPFPCVLSETRCRPGAETILACPHTQHTPAFNATACRYQSCEWIREQFPRFDAICTTCNQPCTIYASLDHAIAGGWWAAPRS